jgi:2'-5' RNA ligase
VVTVPEAEPVVGKWRQRHTYDAPLGMPAHLTVLFPFVPAERVAAAEEPLARLVAGVAAFRVEFRRTARFPDVLYLAPEPSEPFLALTGAISAEWPEHPPYEGVHETVIPHLTVAESEDEALLDSIAAEVKPQLPVAARVREVAVFVEAADGLWHEHGRLPLAEAG